MHPYGICKKEIMSVSIGKMSWVVVVYRVVLGLLTAQEQAQSRATNVHCQSEDLLSSPRSQSPSSHRRILARQCCRHSACPPATRGMCEGCRHEWFASSINDGCGIKNAAHCTCASICPSPHPSRCQHWMRRPRALRGNLRQACGVHDTP